MEKWSDILPSAVKVPITAYKYRHQIQKWWKWVQARYDKGSTDIVVLGRPGVGKSVMMSYLYGESNHLSWQLPGKQNLSCQAIPFCSYEADFEWNEEIIDTQIKGEENRKALTRIFFKTIANF